MTALFVKPEAFTVQSADQSSLQPASNLAQDHAGFLWSMATASTTATITLFGSGQSIDTIALVGSNLTSADTVRYRVATTQAGLSSATYSTAVPAFTGTLGEGFSAKTVIKLASPIAFGWMQIFINIASSRIVTAQRLVIGRAIVAAGIDVGAEQGFEDRSVMMSGAGWTGVQEFVVVPSWKVGVSWISKALWRSDWQPFHLWSGQKKAFLFVPAIEDPHPHDIIFGRSTSQAKGENPGADVFNLELNITALAP
jgi:hypothetical protein